MPRKPEKTAAADIDTRVGRRLRGRRIELRLTQADLANGLGISFQQVQKYETGSNRMGASRLMQVAQILQVTPSYFFEGAKPVKREGSVEPDIANLDEFLSDTTAQALVRAFTTIKRKELRREVVNLVDALADADDADLLH